MSIPGEKAKTRTSRSLTATLAIAFLTLSVVVLLIASSIEVYLNFRSEQEIIANQQQLIAQEAANTVASFIQEKFSVLEAAVKLGSPTASAPEEQQRVLDNLLGLQPSFRHLILLDTQEQELARTSRLSQAVWESFTGRIESDVFEQVRLGQRYISPVQVDEVTSEPLVIMAVPATDIFGDFQGTLIAEVNLKFMWDLVDQLEIGETGQAYVVDRQGNLIAFGDIARVLRGENVSHLHEVAEFTSSSMSVDETIGNVFEGIEGTAVVGTYVPLGTPDWAVVTELPVQEAYQPVIQGIVLSVGVILAMAALAGIMGVYVARRLAVPLLDLTETATHIAEGELSLEATAKGPRETIRLADAFNSMTTQLRGLIGSLEERVADRTRDLALAVDVGRSVSQVRDLDKLLAEAVETIRDRFDLYYTQIYLADTEERTLTLRAGTGTVGKELLRRGHHLLIAPGSINGVAAVKKRAVIVADTVTSSIFRANSLLPDTRSEMAVPLIAGERVVGVIDLQSAKPNALSEDNLPAFEALAGQLAIAIENANLFTEVSQARSELEARIRDLARENWQQFLDGIHQSERLGYSYDLSSVKPLDEPLTSEEGNGILATDIAVTGEPVGTIKLEAEQDKIWTPDETALVASVAQQVGQQIENLRLLAEAERYQVEAEEATRRLVREGWKNYQQEVPMAPGYVYDQNEVVPLRDEPNSDDPEALRQGLTVRGETIGYLEVAETGRDDGETAELVTAVAEQLSAHIENLRLSEQTELALAETKQRSEELAVINEISRVATSILETKALLETVMNQLQRVLPIDSFTTALFDRPANSLRFLFVYDRVNGVQYDLPPMVVEPHHISHRIIQTREPEMVLFTAQEAEENRRNQPPNLISDKASTTASFLFAPMMRGDEVMGLISVQSYQINAYTDSDLSLVTGVASYVATALQNAQLFQEIRQRGERERIINQVSEKIQRTLTVEDALQTAVTALGQALNVSHARVEIMEAVSQTAGETAVSSGNGDK